MRSLTRSLTMHATRLLNLQANHSVVVEGRDDGRVLFCALVAGDRLTAPEDVSVSVHLLRLHTSGDRLVARDGTCTNTQPHAQCLRCSGVSSGAYSHRPRSCRPDLAQPEHAAPAAPSSGRFCSPPAPASRSEPETRAGSYYESRAPRMDGPVPPLFAASNASLREVLFSFPESALCLSRRDPVLERPKKPKPATRPSYAMEARLMRGGWQPTIRRDVRRARGWERAHKTRRRFLSSGRRTELE